MIKKSLAILALAGTSTVVSANDKPSIVESVAIYGGLGTADIYFANKGDGKPTSSQYAIWGLKTATMVALDQAVEKKDRKWIRIFNIALSSAIVTNYLIKQHRSK